MFTESFKFIREFPLTQEDLARIIPGSDDYDNLLADYTPPENITLIFTDLDVFTPSAVSDELIGFYNC